MMTTKKQVKMEGNKIMDDFKVQCNVCGQIYENWSGSTPCCGSIAFMIDENGNKTDRMVFNVIVNSDK